MSFGLDRLASSLDMYSSQTLPRVASWAVLVSAVAAIGLSAPSISLLGSAALSLLVWANRHRFLLTIDELLARHGWLIVMLPLLVAGAGLVREPPSAFDDLLRHIVAVWWPGGYADMYVHVDPAIRIGNPYWGFDLVAGQLGLWFGPRAAMWLIQLLAWVAFVSVFCSIGWRLLGGRPLAMAMTMLALAVSVQITGPRLFMARPEIFMAIWAISAAVVTSRAGCLVWIAAGTALISGYYLAPIYFPAVILLPFRWRARILVMAGLLAIWAAVWGMIEGEALRELLFRPFSALASQEDGLGIAENADILAWLVTPTMLGLVTGAAWSARRPGAQFALVLLAGYFVLSNQVRFGAVIAPLLALFILSGLGRCERHLPRQTRLLAIVGSTALLFHMVGTSVVRDGSRPSFRLPDGAIVLTAFDEATFSLPFDNPGRIRVAPIFDIGMIAPDARAVVKQLANGQLDCQVVRYLGFSHVVEDSLSGRPPDCLRLLERQRAWSLWALE